MRYWDSSALVPLIVKEKRSQVCEDLLKSDPQIVTWWLSRVECESAINRLYRDGSFNENHLRFALSDVKTLWRSIAEIRPVDSVRSGSLRLLRVHPLKAADALQLSAAIAAAGNSRDTLEFITFDEQLLRAADREGFSCDFSAIS